MNDRQEALKFYKIAFDLSCKELGTNSYLWNTLSKRIGKIKSDSGNSTNPSEEEIANAPKPENAHKKIMKSATRK